LRRDGTDLYLDVPITFTQAALGAALEVDSLDGTVPLQLAAGTQSGSTYRVRGRGMPTVRGNTRGDFLATVHVVVPTKLARRERELLEEYARLTGDHLDERTFFDRVKDAFRPD
jgi:molecular chaperone DnaJ